MTNSLSNLVNKLAEEINKIKYGHDEKTVKRVKLNTEIVKAVLNIQELKIIQLNTNVCVATRITKISLMNT